MAFFSGKVNTRQVNYTGRTTTSQQTKSDLIEQSRRERIQRQYELLRLQCTMKIQRLYRGYKCRIQFKQQVRTQFDQLIQQATNTYTLDILIQLIRYINVILPSSSLPLSQYNKHYMNDVNRLTQLVQLLTKSMKSTDSTQCYQFLLIQSHDTQLQWYTQCKQLCMHILLLCGNVQQISNEQISVSATCMNLLLDTNQSPLLKQSMVINSTLFDAVNVIYSKLYKYVQSVFYVSIRQRLIELTPLSDSLSHTNNKNKKYRISILSLFALSIRPLFLPLNDEYSTNDQVQYVDDFIIRVLSVPLLNYRLQSAQLTILLNSLIQPPLYQLILQQISIVIPQIKSMAQSSYTYYDTTVIQQREARRTAEHKLQDEQDEENGLPNRQRILQPLTAELNNCIWLFGNILAINNIGTIDVQHDSLLINMIHVFAENMSSDDFIQSGQHIQLLRDQYNILKSNTMVSRLYNMLVVNTQSNDTAQYKHMSIITQTIDTLLYKWSAGAIDMMSSLTYRNNIVPLLWNTLQSSGCVNDIIHHISTGSYRSIPTQSIELLNCVSLLCGCYSHQLIVNH